MSNILRTLFLLAIASTCILLCSTSFATDYYVSTTTGSDTTGTGSQAAPWATIQHAIDSVTGTEADPADIRVAAGTYYENLVVNKDYVNLWGGYEPGSWLRDIAASKTIIDGGQNGSCIQFQNVLGGGVDGFTITNGQAEYGGGISCNNSSPTIQNNTICENSADSGGGIQCGYGSSPAIQNNIISGNSAGSYDGGGITCGDGSSPTVRKNTINDNSAEWGGGVFCYDSSPTIENNIISGNSAWCGGGIDCEHCYSVIQNNVISGNKAGGVHGGYGGGGISSVDSTPTIQNNTISDNVADLGGGISCVNSSPLMKNNAFFQNNNYDVYENVSTSDPEAYYNEFYGNTAGIWYDEGSASLTTIAQVNALAEAENNVSVQPGFVPSLTGVSTNISYDSATFQSTLTVASATFSPGALIGLLLNPDNAQPLQFSILSNSATTITVWGNITGVAAIGDTYRVFNYHLESSAALIDAAMDLGIASKDIDGEVRPCGVEYDIGADEYCTQSEGEDEVEELLAWEGIEIEMVPELEEELGPLPELEPSDDEEEIERESLVEEDAPSDPEPTEVESEIEEATPPKLESESEGASPKLTVVPPIINVNICTGARVTASTALAAQLDRLREWRDELLETRIGETIAAAYYKVYSRK